MSPHGNIKNGFANLKNPVATVSGTCLDKGPSVDVANYRNIGVIMAEDSAYTVIGSLLDEVKIMREDCMHLVM